MEGTNLLLKTCLMMWRGLKSGCRLDEQAYIARQFFLKCSIPEVYSLKYLISWERLKPLLCLAPRDGLEPPTQRLTAACSTN
ncbi:MAG: hypothetical protein K0R76_446 [Alphaproteobacteria bacterium]|nr:hypothetical protein [Alphaproteobacteria bacterium]